MFQGENSKVEAVEVSTQLQGKGDLEKWFVQTHQHTWALTLPGLPLSKLYNCLMTTNLVQDLLHFVRCYKLKFIAYHTKN